MPLSLLICVLTLVPALAAILIAALGVARRALAPAVFVLCALGALVPAVGLLIIVPYLGSGEPLRVTLFGGSLAASAWFSAVYRADAFGVYAGLGLTILVAPLLLWMAWKGRLALAMPVTPQQSDGEDATTDDVAPDEEVTGASDEDSDATITRSILPARSWAGVALTLGAESAALTVLFADNILWLALAWLVLVALAWGTGELGAETIDRPGLALMLAGPMLWAVVMLTGAVPAKSPTLFNLMGNSAYSVIQVILLGLVIALAGGAYPFLTWVRRRAALATPAGLGALVLILLPVALFVAARTYAAATDVNGQWAEIGQAAPPVYGSIAWAVLGMVTVAICGLLALERRDSRTLLAYLGVAQIGWGMLALSTGDPASLPGLILLLAGTVCGLGAMLAALFAGATLTDDEELDGAGPQAFGTRFSPASLFAWCAGAVALIGVPLFGGFAPRQLISAAALHLGNLTVPLVGIAWAGDALLALALVRATAPAFTQLASEGNIVDDEDAEDETLAALAADDPSDDASIENDEDDDAPEDDDAEADETDLKVLARTSARQRGDIRAVPAVILGLLAVALGIAPQVLLAFGGTLAASALAPEHAVDRAMRITDVGYATGFGQWLPSLAWGAVVVLALAFTFTRPDSLRRVRLPQMDTQAADAITSPELAGQPEPAETWRELDPVFVSSVALPAGRWLLADTDVETVEPADAATGDESEESEDENVEEPVKVVAPATASRAAVESDSTAGVPAGDDRDDSNDSNDSDDSPPPAERAVERQDEASDAAEMSTAETTPAVQQPVQEAKPVRPATKPVAATTETATSRSATSATKPTAPSTKPPAATAKPTTDAKPAAKSTPPATGTKPSATAKSTTKPSTTKPSGHGPAKSGKSGSMSSSKPGSKKQPGGRS